ncbi:NF-kappa-B inhibitor delta [Denticeps clupeoides]|uniref:NF-kappa-B inhibitor delta n=1 Tax=Denticeps clupeoides TaxID=299321 RepID=A0AAY4AW90_9TELE|nr:NF-kappa-B inhibitor delta [Denticeps clupeoides]
MHWPKSPKEKPCYPLPTVKKLLEQKRKRENSSASPTCAQVPVTFAPAAAHPESSESAQAAAGATASNYSDMGAVGYEQWDLTSIHQPSTALHQSGQLFPMAMGFSFSQSPAFNQPASFSYSQQHMQGYQTPTTSQQYSECPVTASLTGISHNEPVENPVYTWDSGVRLQGNAASSLDHFCGQMDLRKLQEAQLLLRHMDYTWQDDEGDTMLHIYTAKGQREYAYAAAEKLKHLGKLDSKEHKGKSALLVAVTANHPSIVHDLLSLGADVNICDNKGQTALHLAATYGFPEVMQCIFSMGLKINLEARNFEGLTPLHCVAISHSATMKAMAASSSTWVTDGLAEKKLVCLQLLRNAGASLTSQEVKSNKTVLHLAVKEGNISLVHHLLRICPVEMQFIINVKAHGHTALHMAAGLHSSPHQEELICLLLNHGADPSIRNLENDQPAHLLQSGEHGEQLKLILKRKSASSRRRITSLQDQE